MYYVIGADGKEYGPASAADIQTWIAEGRCNAQTLVRTEGTTEWRPLSQYPDLAAFLGGTQPPPVPPPTATLPGTLPLAPNVQQRRVPLDPFECFRQAWHLITGPAAGLIFASCVTWLLIQWSLAGAGQVPFIGMVIGLLSWVVTGPLTGGLYYLVLRCIRGQPGDLGDLFAGFRHRFLQLFLGVLVTTLLLCLMAAPGAVTAVLGVLCVAGSEQVKGLVFLGAFLILLGACLALIPLIYFGVCWWFVLPLIMDKGLDFWQAITLSRRVVHRHWWNVFLLASLATILNFLGLLACCIGMIFTVPLTYTAGMYAYERLFTWTGDSPERPTPAPSTV